MEENKETKKTTSTKKSTVKSKVKTQKEETGKMNVLRAFQVLKVHKYHKLFVKKNYPLSDLRTEKQWEEEFKVQKIID